MARNPVKMENLEVLLEVEDPSLNCIENTIRKKVNVCSFIYFIKKKGHISRLHETDVVRLGAVL